MPVVKSVKKSGYIFIYKVCKSIGNSITSISKVFLRLFQETSGMLSRI